MTESNAAEYKALELGQLAIEHGHWRAMPGYERDRWGCFTLLSEIYEFAIAHYNDPGIELLLQALATAEAEAEPLRNGSKSS